MSVRLVRPVRILRILLLVFAAAAALSCTQQKGPKAAETAYVRGGGVALRDQLGPSSTQSETLKGGEKVEVLSKRTRWVQVRLDTGRTGWVHSRFLASPEVYEQFQHLSDQTRSLPSQGKALIRWDANLHLEPGSDTDTFYRLTEREEVDVLQHRVVEKMAPKKNDSEESASDNEISDVQVGVNEDWLLVRSSGRAGWLRENYVDMNPPLDIARYNEGLKIRAWFVLYEEHDNGETHPWYLWATMRPHAGLPFDFDEIRVFVWNPAKSRYETSYRERHLIGFY